MRVLFLGAHCDDLTLGCGATIHKHRNDWDIHCVEFSSSWKQETREQSRKALTSLGANHVQCLDYQHQDFWMCRQKVWEEVHKLEVTLRPHWVFVHMEDEHQDHCVLYTETIRNFKDTNLVCYKPSMKYGLSHSWNRFEVVEQEDVDAKLAAARYFDTLQDRVYFKPENIVAQMRVCGMHVDYEFAEPFTIYKMIV